MKSTKKSSSVGTTFLRPPKTQSSKFKGFRATNPQKSLSTVEEKLNVSIYMQDMAELDEKPLKYNLAPLRAAVQFTGNIYTQQGKGTA